MDCPARASGFIARSSSPRQDTELPPIRLSCCPTVLSVQAVRLRSWHRLQAATMAAIKSQPAQRTRCSHDDANNRSGICRVETALRRRPEAGLHDDAPAARWEGGMRVVSSHANGSRLSTDMPSELGGSGDQVTPGWLFRAGLALLLLRPVLRCVRRPGHRAGNPRSQARSRSDTRGLLGIVDTPGDPVFAGPGDVQLHVRISASGIPPERLRALVDHSRRCSPIPTAVETAVPIAVTVNVDPF